MHLLFIWNSNNQRSFLGSVELQQFYSSQNGELMDAYEFQQWLSFWYMGVQKRTTETFLFPFDILCGHEQLSVLYGVQCWFCPPGTMSIFQPTHQRVIASLKQRYRVTLVGEFVEAIRLRTEALAQGEKYMKTCSWARLFKMVVRLM